VKVPPVPLDPDRHVETLLETDPGGVVETYRRIFSIPPQVALTPDMVALHWRVEREGTIAMRSANSQDRPAAVERAYTAVYRSCPWLNAGRPAITRPEIRFGHYLTLLGPAKHVYEIGSGKGELITWLSTQGFTCVATEITQERGQVLAPDGHGVTWRTSDGIHLANFEPVGSYDAVISSQVLEHLHPEDLPDHLAGVRAILRLGGRYIFTTPHAFLGPTDLSRVFGLRQPVCHHLKEYRYRDLVGPLRRAGFTRISAFYTPPAAVTRRVPLLATAWSSAGYLHALQLVEQGLDALPERINQWVVRGLRYAMLWRPDISIIAENGVHEGSDDRTLPNENSH
jgi:SAM-dependent methyltransferase